ncbi:methyltransferase domain-containing protein [bacterium]|nr:methyltransferase domain-containing protein [bacterium]
MVREQCPVCSASDIEELIVLDDYPFAGNGVVRADVAKKVPTGTLSVGVCRVCSTLFQMDPISMDDLDAMLQRQPYPLTQAETGMEVAETDRFLEAFRKYAPPQGKVLDVGCGTGSLMNTLKKLGYEVSGVEANPKAVEVAKKQGFDVVEGRFEEGMFPDETFDIIVTRSVLDHAIEPSTLLATMENILKPGGILACEVPNISRVFRRSAFGGFNHHHLMYWTTPTLRYALTYQGLDLLGGFEESYIAMFGQKADKGEDAIEPVPPTDVDIDQAFEDVDRFLERKDRLAEELPAELEKHCPNGVVVLGAGTPTVDMLYYTGMEEMVNKVTTTDKTRVGGVLGGYDFEIAQMDFDKHDTEAVLVSSERRQEELLEHLESYLDHGGRVIRFRPGIEMI